MDTKALRQKILDLAIRGKLVPQDPNDEPASVLLERIREQKQQMVKEGKLKKKDIKNDSVIFVGEDSLHYEKFADGSMKCIEDEIPFELPEGWCWARLKHICMMAAGKAKSSDQIKSEPFDGCYPCFGGNGIRGYVDEYNQEGTFSIVGRQGALCGNINIASGKFYATEHAVVTTLFNGIDFNWSNYTLEALKLNEYATGAAQPGLSVANVLNVFVPVPPTQEQIYIGHQISKSIKIIENITDEKEDLQTLISAAKSKILDLAIHGQLIPQNPDDEPASVLLERIRAEKEELIKRGKIKRDKKESIIFKGEDNSYYQRVELDGVVITQRVDIPSTWAACCLQEITYPISTVGMQIKSDEIQKEGVFPVISQGQIFIDGYCSDESKVIHDSPIILFGDHTRNVKYIDFPFVVGADGTKLHKAFQINERYVYYWMCYASQKITDRGYARHYSLLQKECFHLPPLAEQSRIVNCIDSLYAKLDSIGNEIL